MKAILSIIALMGFVSTAQAANCETVYGAKAHVSVSGNYLSIHFMDGPYRSVTLRANGETETNYYFRSRGLSGSLAIVNKTVLSNGTGKVHYKYRNGGSRGNGTNRFVNLYCK